MGLLNRLGRYLLFGLLIVYLVLPVLAVVLYSLATRWTAHVLPDGYTIVNWRDALTSYRFVSVALRTIVLSIIVTVLDILLVVPAVYWQRVHNPRIRIFLELAAAIPFSLPFVLIAFGILILSGDVVPFLQGTFVLLVLACVAVEFSFLYWAVDGAMAAANIQELDEAAKTCGASPLAIFWRVVIPNIGPGIATGGMLVFAGTFGEFAIVQILIGNRFETVPLYSLDLMRGTNANYNLLAVITCISFAIVFITSVAASYLNRGQGESVQSPKQAIRRR